MAIIVLGPWVGWGWSILLELISLWLWYRPESGVIAWWVWRTVALTTTMLLLTGPLYQVSAPLFASRSGSRRLTSKLPALSGRRGRTRKIRNDGRDGGED